MNVNNELSVLLCVSHVYVRKCHSDEQIRAPSLCIYMQAQLKVKL